jgi:hypothetical protein
MTSPGHPRSAALQSLLDHSTRTGRGEADDRSRQQRRGRLLSPAVAVTVAPAIASTTMMAAPRLIGACSRWRKIRYPRYPVSPV